MIFATVGTHEQPFDRLIQCLDELREDDTIQEDVMIQIGYSSYEPKLCGWNRLISYQDMVRYTKDARIVITHGGPSSMLLPFQFGKVPIVVPRRCEFGEHINNHQLDFIRTMEARIGQIIPVYEIGDLKEAILRYDDIVASISTEIKSNNARFNQRLEELVRGMF